MQDLKWYHIIFMVIMLVVGCVIYYLVFVPLFYLFATKAQRVAYKESQEMRW